MPARERWLLESLGRAPAKIRLVCLPYAGAGASLFRSWIDRAPTGMQITRVQLPGREHRSGEDFLTDVSDVIAVLAELFVDDVPTAIYGHSLGGILGFELCAALTLRGSTPVRFFAGACRPSHVPDPYQLHRLSESDFVEALRERGGIAEEILSEPELREFLLPLLRADLMLAERWQRPEPLRLGIPISVCAAPADLVVPWDVTSRWSDCAADTWERQAFAGDHFFIRSNPEMVLQFIISRLRADGFEI